MSLCKCVVGMWCLGFHVPYWVSALAGLMLYGNGYWGVTEANYALVLIHFISATLGAGVWTTHVFEHVPSPLLWHLPKGVRP